MPAPLLDLVVASVAILCFAMAWIAFCTSLARAAVRRLRRTA